MALSPVTISNALESDASNRLRFLEHGFVMVERVVEEASLATLQTVLTVATGRAGSRRILGFHEVVDSLCRTGELKALAEHFLGPQAFPVRAILFDKTPEANWRVPWHQDVTIPVAERIDCEGFGGWSQKAGVWHVNPPASILAGMVTLRLHLDDCPESNGPLRVLPGSHRHRILTTEQVETAKRSITPLACVAEAGDVLAMSPLLLHASSPAETANHRRVLHVEYACASLPGGLSWAEC